MAHTIFLSWQLDTPSTEGRNLIEKALKMAIRKIEADATLEKAIRCLKVDKDTQGVPGSPPIVDTILRKIDAAAIFVPDLTFVGQRRDGRLTPNPNVLVEYGYALKSLTHSRILPVMNVVFGRPTSETLPFDLQHLRHPIQYECAEGASDADRAAARDMLAKQFASAIRTVFQSDQFEQAIKPVAPAEPHPHDVKLLGRVREMLSPEIQTFLVRHDFRNPFHNETLSPLHEMSDNWVGAAHKFHDPLLQENFDALMQALSKLVTFVDNCIFQLEGPTHFGSPLTDEDRRQGRITKTTRESIGAMNGAAEDLSRAIDSFEEVARPKFRA